MPVKRVEMQEEGSAWAQAERILCVRLDGMGDVLMTSPAIRVLKRARHGRHITLLTSTAGADIGGLVPECDEVIAYDAPWMKATAPARDGRGDIAMAERLRKAGFDAAVIFTVFSQNPLPAAFLCYLAGIPLRLAHCRENPYQLLTHWVRDTEPESGVRHEVRRQLELVAAVGCHAEDEQLSLRVPVQAKARVDRLLQDLGLGGDGGWVVIHPGATAPSRRYPPEKFAAVADQLADLHDLRTVFTGTEGELELVERVRGTMRAPSHSLTGKLSLPGMAALLARAPVLISNNTGPVHMAAAVGTPVVDLYALTNPQHTPWGVPSRILFHDVPCRYCLRSVCPEGHHDCLRRVRPEDVVQAALELLGLTSTKYERTPMPAMHAFAGYRPATAGGEV